MDNTLKIYQKRLTNLSSRNRALLLLNLVKRQFADFHDFDLALGESSFELLEQVVAQKKRIPLCQVVDSRDSQANTLSKQLNDIQRQAKQIFEESGAKDLYIGYPFVEGKFLDDTMVRCPLLYFPVELEIHNGKWCITSRKDVNISFNKTFLLAYSHFNFAKLDDDFIDHDFSEEPSGSQDFRTMLYRLLKESPIELNFNPKTFEDQLRYFQAHTKLDFENLMPTGELKVQPEAVIGLFPQAGSYLMPDYDKLIEQEDGNSLENLFAPEGSLLNDPDVRTAREHIASNEEELITPYALDASQEHVVKQVKSGKSVVVQGPPGSGKSQLICNLISDYLSKNKNVLVVSQKRAALDVVYERLKGTGLEEFAALVHDFKNDRRAVYDEVSRQIENLEQYKLDNNSLDAIYLERDFLKFSREIDSLSQRLEEFREALFDISECGLTVKELYLSSDFQNPTVDLHKDYRTFHFDEYAEFIHKLETYFDYASRFEVEKFPWVDRLSFAQLSLPDMQRLKATVAEVPAFLAETAAATKEVIFMEVSMEECDWVLSQRPLFDRLLLLLKEPQVYSLFQACLQVPNTDALWLSNRKNLLLNSFGEDGVANALTLQEIPDLQLMIDEALEAKEKWYRWATWKTLSKNREAVELALQKEKLPNTTEGLKSLLSRIDNRLNLEHNITKVLEAGWVTNIPKELLKERFERWFADYAQALEAKKIFLELRNAIRYLNAENLSYQEFNEKITTLFAIVEKVPEARNRWKKDLSMRQIRDLEEKHLKPEIMVNALDLHFDAICAFDKLKASMSEAELHVIELLKEAVPSFDEKEAVALYDNSIRVVWINHIEAKYPILREVSSGELAQAEFKLQNAIHEKQKLCKDILTMKVKERVYADVKYNRLNNLVTYRELNHQVNKKRSVWPLRKLIQSYAHELLDLVPCWLASPETVSAIFPLERTFDLVIFDEASQCFVEKGIPSMFRGKQVVIAGDSKQLAPHDLYQPRWEEDHEESPALEVDSLLDLGCQYLEQLQLEQHYRSKSLDLIDFSNTHFYGNKLSMLPQFKDFVNKKPNISYLQVAGVWEKNANEAEADKVVKLITALLHEKKESIGIITFNFKQQELIYQKLEEAQISIPASVFIKNIENVQGDERDYIIFSVGYAPSASGKFAANFGTLNLEKGENRLNVAITRAKQHIYLVCSILPSQLQVDDTKNEGPKLLKKYLQYAWEVSNGKFTPNLSRPKANHIHWLLKQKLSEISFPANLAQELPFADLAISSYDLLGVLLTDDDHYYASHSAKEAHAYKPQMLSRNEWKHKRFYSREFWLHRTECITQVERFILSLKD